MPPKPEPKVLCKEVTTKSGKGLIPCTNFATTPDGYCAQCHVERFGVPKEPKEVTPRRFTVIDDGMVRIWGSGSYTSDQIYVHVWEVYKHDNRKGYCKIVSKGQSSWAVGEMPLGIKVRVVKLNDDESITFEEVLEGTTPTTVVPGITLTDGYKISYDIQATVDLDQPIFEKEEKKNVTKTLSCHGMGGIWSNYLNKYLKCVPYKGAGIIPGEETAWCDIFYEGTKISQLKVDHKWGSIYITRMMGFANMEVCHYYSDMTILMQNQSINPPSQPLSQPESKKESHMNGQVFSGVVVRSINVPSGDGLSTGIVKSEAVYTKNSFVATDAAHARVILVAEAAVKATPKIVFDDPTAIIEVRLAQFGA